MSIKALLLPVVFASLPMTAQASELSNGSLMTPNCIHFLKQLFCRAYNREGITCDQVGMSEGQVGAPWGDSAGTFSCVNGCLQWVEPPTAPIDSKDPVAQP